MTTVPSNASNLWLALTGGLAMVALALAPGIVRAETDAQRYQRGLDEMLAAMNERCGTRITLAPIDSNAFSKAGASASTCEILETVKRSCTKDSSNDPHPAAGAFVRDHIKSISCALLPANPQVQKAVVKLSIRNGVLAYQVTPGYFSRDESRQALESDPAFSKLHEAKRLWGLYNEELPAESKGLKAACGDDIKMSIDLPSWQRAGHLKRYPDVAVASLCESYARGLATACTENKAAVRARVSGIRCGLLGKDANSPTARPEIRFEGRELVVFSPYANSGKNAQHVYDALKD